MTAKKILERIRPLSARFVSFLIGFHLLPQLLQRNPEQAQRPEYGEEFFGPTAKKYPGGRPGDFVL